jgi:general secretion pathway protein G
VLNVRRIAAAAAFVAGFLVAPLFIVGLGRAVRSFINGLDLTGEQGVAVIGARDLAAAVDRYRGHYQHVPEQKQGLGALVPEFLEFIPNDPWNNPYVYESTGPNFADVLSYGADGRPGGGGDGADISARFGRMGAHAPGYLRSLTTLVIAGLPVALMFGARKWRWCACALAGMSAFWAVVLLATTGPPQGATLRTTTLPMVSFVTGFACVSAAIGLLRKLPNASRIGLASIVTAYVLLQYLVAV